MQTQLPQIYYIIFTAITALGVLLQAFVLLGMFFAIRETTKKVHALSDDFQKHVMPTISAARRIIDDLAPKIKLVSADVVDITHTVRDQTKHANATMDDVLNKTTAQAARVNEMTGAVLDTIDHAAAVIGQSVARPVRKATSVVAGVRAGLSVLLQKRAQTTPPPPHVDVEVSEEVIPR